MAIGCHQPNFLKPISVDDDDMTILVLCGMICHGKKEGRAHSFLFARPWGRDGIDLCQCNLAALETRLFGLGLFNSARISSLALIFSWFIFLLEGRSLMIASSSWPVNHCQRGEFNRRP